MELHMVHKSADGHLAVIGVLLREGEPNPFISRVNYLLCIYDNPCFLFTQNSQAYYWVLHVLVKHITIDKGQDQFHS